jgi:hypothetical protein
MGMKLYLTTKLQTEHSSYLNSAANYSLTPVRHLFGGRTFEIIGTTPQEINTPPSNSMLKTAFMILVIIPGLLLGIVLRAVSLSVKEVRVGFNLVQNPPAPPPPVVIRFDPLNPAKINSDVGDCLNFFSVVKTVGEEKAPAWYEKEVRLLGFNPFDLCSNLKADRDVVVTVIGKSKFGRLQGRYAEACAVRAKLERIAV